MPASCKSLHPSTLSVCQVQFHEDGQQTSDLSALVTPPNGLSVTLLCMTPCLSGFRGAVPASDQCTTVFNEFSAIVSLLMQSVNGTTLAYIIGPNILDLKFFLICHVQQAVYWLDLGGGRLVANQCSQALQQIPLRKDFSPNSLCKSVCLRGLLAMQRSMCQVSPSDVMQASNSKKL